MVRLHITFLHFTARNRCGTYNPVTPDISFWLVRTKTTKLKIVTLLAKSTPDLFKLTWVGPTTRLDLNKDLLAGLLDDTVAMLQKCQNIAARVITRTRIRDHSNPVLMNLHWLPVIGRSVVECRVREISV